MDKFKVTYLHLQYTVHVFVTFDDKGMWFKKKRRPPPHLKVWEEINVKNKYQIPWVLLGSVCINMVYVQDTKFEA